MRMERKFRTSFRPQFERKKQLKLNPFPHMDIFLRLCSRRLFEYSDKRRNCSKLAIFPFATMFPSLSHRLSIQLQRFSIFLQNTFSHLLQKCRMTERVNHIEQIFQLLSIILLSFKEIFHLFCLDVFKMVCCIFILCEKGFRLLFFI